jgi:stringent starvation protein B
MIDSKDATSTRPYLVRALYEWCTDNGLTPYVAVQVDDTVRVPNEYVKDGEIVLNISFDATSSLKLGNDFIEFKARFAGTAREIMVPMDRVLAIYARENGQGMAFPVSSAKTPVGAASGSPEAKPVSLASVSSRASPAVSLPAGHAATGSGQPGEARPLHLATGADTSADDPPSPPPQPPKPSGTPRPALKRVK